MKLEPMSIPVEYKFDALSATDRLRTVWYAVDNKFTEALTRENDDNSFPWDCVVTAFDDTAHYYHSRANCSDSEHSTRYARSRRSDAKYYLLCELRDTVIEEIVKTRITAPDNNAPKFSRVLSRIARERKITLSEKYLNLCVEAVSECDALIRKEYTLSLDIELFDGNKGAEYYFHKSSCWWGGYSHSADNFENNKGYAVMLRDKNGQPWARLWALQFPDKSVGLFNHYGAMNCGSIATLIAAFLDKDITQRGVDCDSECMYANDDYWYFLHDKGTKLSRSSAHHPMFEGYGCTCSHCEERANEDDMTYVEGVGGVCEHCLSYHYYHCDRCEEWHSEPTTSVYVARHHSEEMCDSCVEDNAFHCDECNTNMHTDHMSEDSECLCVYCEREAQLTDVIGSQHSVGTVWGTERVGMRIRNVLFHVEGRTHDYPHIRVYDIAGRCFVSPLTTREIPENLHASLARIANRISRLMPHFETPAIDLSMALAMAWANEVNQ